MLAFTGKILYTAFNHQLNTGGAQASHRRNQTSPKGVPMASTVEELTIAYEEDGQEIVRELDKRVLTKGAWSTVLFRYQDLNRSTGEFGPEKYVIRRYQKVQGDYRPKSKFVISSAKQARQIMDALTEWLEQAEEK
jgi:hypothetical protein